MGEVNNGNAQIHNTLFNTNINNRQAYSLQKIDLQRRVMGTNINV